MHFFVRLRVAANVDYPPSAQAQPTPMVSTSARESAAAPNTVPLRLALRLFLPFAAGYFLSYLLRNVNAVMAPELTRELGLTAAELGLLTSAYLLTFGTFQLPLGVLLDRYGPVGSRRCCC